MNSKKVTAIIPTYNYGRFVCDAVDSALAQSWPDMEVLVVDDGSTDDTPERLKKYEGRIRVIRQENRGLSAARNTGIREATGEYVAFLDSDDEWLPEKTAAQMRLVEEQGFEVVVIREGERNWELTFDECFFISPGFGSTALVKRSLFDEVGGFDESLRSVEDRDMMLRLTRGGRRIGVVAEPLVRIRQHAASMSRKAERMEDSFRTVLNKAFEWPEMRGRSLLMLQALGFFYRDSTWTYFEEGRRAAAMQRLMMSMLCWPLPWGTGFAGTRMKRVKLAARLLLGDKLFQRGQGTSVRKPPTKRVLFITWFFPPSAGAGVQRTARFVKYLRDFGYEPIVVAPKEDTYRRDPLSFGEDRSFLSEIPADVKVYRVPACQPFGLLRLLKKLKLLWLWSFFVRPDEKLTWALAAAPAAIKIARRENVDLICQNVGPWSTSLVGLLVKARTGKPLVYDIRDPWTQWSAGGWPTPMHFDIERRLERWVLSKADGISILGDAYRAELLMAHPHLDPDRVAPVPNGFDLDVPPPPRPGRSDGEFRIVHAGKFYDTWGSSGKRSKFASLLKQAYDGTFGQLRYSPRQLDSSTGGPKFLVDGLARFAKRNPELAKKVRMEFIGRVHPRVKQQAEALGLSEQVLLPGQMPHDECVTRLAEADLLFLPLFRWRDGKRMAAIPLKLYEYMASGQPVLCAAPEGDMKETLMRAGTGIFVEPDDPDSIGYAIEKAVILRDEGRPIAKPDWNYISSFHRRALTGRLAVLMDRVLADSKPEVVRAEARVDAPEPELVKKTTS